MFVYKNHYRNVLHAHTLVELHIEFVIQFVDMILKKSIANAAPSIVRIKIIIKGRRNHFITIHTPRASNRKVND